MVDNSMLSSFQMTITDEHAFPAINLYIIYEYKGVARLHYDQIAIKRYPLFSFARINYLICLFQFSLFSEIISRFYIAFPLSIRVVFL